jgi:ATP-dependent DNA helicase RecG
VDKKTFLKLSSPVQYIKGVGPKRSEYLKNIGVELVGDLMFLVPRRYLDYSAVVKIKDIKVDDEVTTIGAVRAVRCQRTRKRGDLLSVLVYDETGAVMLKWFNRPELRRKFKVGDWLIVSGKATFYYGKQLINPLYEILEEDVVSEKRTGAVIPVYPLTEGLSIWDIRRFVRIALDECLGEVEESLPPYIRERNKLMQLDRAIRSLHFPASAADAVQARRRLVYEEFFFFELALARRKAEIKDAPGLACRETGILTRKFVASLPYRLTAKQEEVIREIAEDMGRPKPMNRLLQGDVGSGKTVVALYAMLIAVENGCQAVLMAPTEILAEQHFLTLRDLVKNVGVAVTLLTGSLMSRDREQAIRSIASGAARIIVGTHALIEEQVVFERLGLAVVDEQHRFGVMQRAALVFKGSSPDFLVLSATPIPRTLALTLYGDLDVSVLDEKPPGRGSVVTRIVHEKERPQAYEFIARYLAEGRQMFVICPIIEQSEKMELKSVHEVRAEMNSAFPEVRVAAIHGRLQTDERITIMDEFRRGAIAVLVATTVIEVGVDIPNATLMIIEHPERFGLAQLHQLRGRIGRGLKESFCFLFLSSFLTQETYERVALFASTTDGFVLARNDMKQRGPGEILGKRQHGLPDIRIGDLEDDQDILFLARDDAFGVVEKDPDLGRDEHQFIRRKVLRFAERESLLRIG